MVATVLAIAATAGALVVLRGWRLAVPLLLVFDLLRIALVWQVAPPSPARGTVLLAELTTAIGVAAILLSTASRWGGSPQRRAGGALSIAILTALVLAPAALNLADSGPVTGDRGVDSAMLFGVLCGLALLLRAGDVLELGLGLLLLAGSAKLLYFVTSQRPQVLQVGLWEALSLGLALVTAVFCGLLYGRLLTLELGRLPDGEP